MSYTSKIELQSTARAPGRVSKPKKERTFVERAFRAVKPYFPHTRWGDRLFSYVGFRVSHKRAPTDAMLFNDVLYRIKTSEEILDPLRVFVSDKEFVKMFVKSVVGDRHNVPTLDIIRTVDAVDAYEFPAQCCIKPTHASGQAILRRNGEPVDREAIKRWFDMNYYTTGREANYRPLKPKVIIEPLVFGNSNPEDYKIFCFNGVPKLIQVDVDRYLDHRRKYFDAQWRELDFSILYPKAEKAIPRPGNLEEMLAVAAELSKHFDFVRVDLYSDGKQALVGEITHCAECAAAKFIPLEAEKTVSKYVFS
jgi:hypothetical protein